MTTREDLEATPWPPASIFGSLMGYINSAQQIFLELYAAGAWFPVLFGCVARDARRSPPSSTAAS